MLCSVLSGNYMIGQSAADASTSTALLHYIVQEAGWLWSGGVALDTPGDQFVKIRHRCACPSVSMPSLALGA